MTKLLGKTEVDKHMFVDFHPFPAGKESMDFPLKWIHNLGRQTRQTRQTPGYGGGSTARHQDGLGTWQKGDRPSLTWLAWQLEESHIPSPPFLTDFQICVKVSHTKPY